MDGDKFSDPRTRSKRGRGRGRTRGRHPRGKGGVSHGRATSHGRAESAKTATAASNTKEEIDSNAFRFQEYDEIRAAARRGGVTQDVDFYEREEEVDGDGDNSEDDASFNAEEARRTAVDSFVADAGEQDGASEETAASLVRHALASDFGRLAKTLDAAPLWARLGDAACFALSAENQSLYALLETEDESLSDDGKNSKDNVKLNDRQAETDDDIAELMRDLDALDVEQSYPQKEKETVTFSTEGAEKSPLPDIDDNDFDRWLDEV